LNHHEGTWADVPVVEDENLRFVRITKQQKKTRIREIFEYGEFRLHYVVTDVRQVDHLN